MTPALPSSPRRGISTLGWAAPGTLGAVTPLSPVRPRGKAPSLEDEGSRAPLPDQQALTGARRACPTDNPHEGAGGQGLLDRAPQMPPSHAHELHTQGFRPETPGHGRGLER